MVGAQEVQVVGRTSPNNYVPADSRTLDSALSSAQSPDKALTRTDILQASARQHGLRVVPTPGVRGAAVPLATTAMPTPAPRSLTPIVTHANPPAPFQYARYFTPIAIDLVDEAGLTSAERLRVQQWLSSFPNEQLQQIRRIVLRHSVDGGELPVLEGQTLIVSVPANRTSPTALLSHLSLGVGYAYYQQGFVEADKKLFQSIYPEEDQRALPYIFATAFAHYLTDSQARLTMSLDGSNPSAVQTSLFVASLFAQRNTQSVSMFNAGRPQGTEFVRAIISPTYVLSYLRVGLYLQVPFIQSGRLLTLGNQKFFIVGNQIVGSTTSTSPTGVVTPNLTPWRPSVPIDESILKRFASLN